MEDRFAYKHAGELLKDEPIEVHSLQLYPITMENYTVFRACRPALLMRLGALPAVYAVMPFISALYAMDFDSIERTGKAGGGLASMMALLCLAMRLPVEYATELIKFTVDPENPRNLKKISINQAEMRVTITPTQFGDIRRVIAIQNGEELPDESENPELVEALNEKARLTGPALEENIFDLISSVAYKSHLRPKEIMDWTIREFEYRRRAIEREDSHLICAVLEANGATFKKGNPTPSWCYDRARGLTDGFILEDEMIEKLSMVGEVRK